MPRTSHVTLLTAIMLATGFATGNAADQPVPGTKLAVQQSSTGKLSFSSKAALVAPTPGGPDDPRTGGATFRIYNPDSGESATFDLPASNWVLKGGSSVYYKFTNPASPAGPSQVKISLLRGGRQLSVKAKATGITLNEPTQGRLGVVFTSGSVRYCALFAPPFVKRDQVGKFQAKKAPVPIACPPDGSTTTTSTIATTSTTNEETTTTTTTEPEPSTTTTSTLPPPSCPPPASPLGSITFTVGNPTSSCGGRRITPGPADPTTGEVLDINGTNLRDLGLGCLYLGGGANGALPPAAIPGGSKSVLAVSGASGLSLTLAASPGSGPADCTLGSGPLRHCVNGNPGTDTMGLCTTDDDCGGQINACLLDANCYFGPPLGVPTTPTALSTCVVNAIKTDSCGSADLLTMNSSLSVVLSTRLYLTSDGVSPCPTCNGTTCQGGANAGNACTGMGTSNECPPLDAQYIGELSVSLAPLTTGTTTVTAPDGLFCPGQTHPGAFGRFETRTITQTGAPLGGLPLSATLAGVFCVPVSGSGLVDPILDVPGPGSVSVQGGIQICLPSLGFLCL